jgi:hypothetical protein
MSASRTPLCRPGDAEDAFGFGRNSIDFSPILTPRIMTEIPMNQYRRTTYDPETIPLNDTPARVFPLAVANFFDSTLLANRA